MIATIKIEIMAGSNIDSAFGEAIRLSKMLTCWIEFNFNGVVCNSRPDGNIKKGVYEYNEAIKSKLPYKFANATQKLKK